MDEDQRGEARQGTARHEELPVPHDLQIELHDDPEAAAAFAALPPSRRREYIDWIISARRPETRMDRVEETARRVKRKQPGTRTPWESEQASS